MCQPLYVTRDDVSAAENLPRLVWFGCAISYISSLRGNVNEVTYVPSMVPRLLLLLLCNYLHFSHKQRHTEKTCLDLCDWVDYALVILE